MIVDRFDHMTLHLAGEQLPPLPALPGRRYRCQDDGEDEFIVPTIVELQERFDLTRQGAWIRLDQFRKTGDRKALLAPKTRKGKT